MFNRLFALGLVIGVLAGYILAGSSVKAQNASGASAAVFVLAGDELTLQFARGTISENVSTVRCSVLVAEGTWVKCAMPDTMAMDRTQKWVNLAYVLQVTKREK